jgi:hypothetical protein
LPNAHPLEYVHVLLEDGIGFAGESGSDDSLHAGLPRCFG